MWWRTVIQVLGGSVGVYALVLVYAGLWFRMDTAGELPETLRRDAEVGGWSAAAVVLLGVPPAGKNSTRWWVRVGLVACLAWAVTSGGLMWTHYDQYLVRTTRPG